MYLRHIIIATVAVLLSAAACSPLDDVITDDPVKNEQTPDPEPDPEKPDPVPDLEPEPVPEPLCVPEIRIYTKDGRNVESKDEYLGIYVLTDQVEKKKNRVDIEDDGFLFENDNYFWSEPLNFMTERRGYWYTFKYPDPEDGEIIAGVENFFAARIEWLGHTLTAL